MSMSSAITLAQLERAMKYVKAYHDGPLATASGTVVINGDLDADLIVNGNLQVSGTISGNAVATGTITYGELTGTITENASIYKCDISVEDGNLTFSASLSYNDAGEFHITATTTLSNSAKYTRVYSVFNLNTTSLAPTYINNTGTFIIENHGAIICSYSGSGSSGTGTAYGIINSGAFIIKSGGSLSGSIRGASSSSSSVYLYGINNSGAFTVENGGIIDLTFSLGYHTYCINNSGTFTVENGSAVTLYCASGNMHRGINNTGAFIANGCIEITITSSSYTNGGYGIYTTNADNSFIIGDGGTVTTCVYCINNGATVSSKIDVYCENGSFIVDKGGTLIAAAAPSGYSNSHGIYNKALFTVKDGGVVTADVNNSYANSSSQYFSLYNTGTFIIENNGMVSVGTKSAYRYNGCCHGIYNTNGTFTIEDGGIVTATGLADNGYGVYNDTENGFVVSGTLYANADSDENCIYEDNVVVDETGKVYLNGALKE